MADSPSRSSEARSPGAAEPPAGGHGVWKLTLWNGSVRFDPWFYRRLLWPAAVKRTRLDDLKPYLPAGAFGSRGPRAGRGQPARTVARSGLGRTQCRRAADLSRRHHA